MDGACNTNSEDNKTQSTDSYRVRQHKYDWLTTKNILDKG
jgi:hypothetical protein